MASGTDRYFAQSGVTIYPNITATTQLPNVSGATIQTGALQVGDLAIVSGTTYVCSTTTIGSAIWSIRPLINVLGLEVIQTVAGASATIEAGVTRVLVTYAAALCTLTLPTVAAGAPIGTKIVIHKANTGAFKIVMTPDSGSNINAGTTDATQDMVTGNATASTTASSASTNDVTAVYTRVTATQWRSGAN
jgi:hypothetical protein